MQLELEYAQSKDLWRISRLDVKPFSLTRVACDDREVGASNGENRAAVLAVRVELTLLRGHHAGHLYVLWGRGLEVVVVVVRRQGVCECVVWDGEGDARTQIRR